MIDFIKTHKYVWLALYFLAYSAVFIIIEHTAPTEGYWVTDLPIDDRIPFVPQMVWFYIMWYPLFVAVGIPTMILNADAFKRWMYYLMITLTASFVFYVLVPNGQHLRPNDMEVTGVATWLLAGLWKADTCTNVFPSMHVIGCIGDIAAVFDSRIFGRRWGALVIVCCVLCSVSTVFVKQHAIIDAAGALAFAVPGFFIVYSRRFFGKSKGERLES